MAAATIQHRGKDKTAPSLQCMWYFLHRLLQFHRDLHLHRRRQFEATPGLIVQQNGPQLTLKGKHGNYYYIIDSVLRSPRTDFQGVRGGPCLYS